ncbi:MAG TPA: bifunctional D-glycero-beta-D-manno-heptose-7-phosphate kinase/D-glycero-beta-D-manno-heptose 1-phosphate adenylyltransferase HldE [Gammaproteobacteria bacterium]|nr:bifunctional D-glycero-beta-D-manno-heptose-7-phosphate kinase/D-glycero-beta-D-manno-heptose 1-phosphate adenylyltransferase HldE [Gammaproteobacteria bacterium]
MTYRLPATLPAFDASTVLIVGDVMLDRYWFGDTARVSPEAPVPVVKVNHVDNRPGGAANVALNIAALGVHSYLIGLTGEDEAACTLEKQLETAGVKHRLCKSGQISTTTKLRVISRHQQLLRMDFEETIQHTQQKELIAHYEKHLGEAQLVILSDYHKGVLLDPQPFIQLARAKGIPVLVDPKSTDFNIYRQADILTPNFKEFESVVGACPDEAIILEKGRALLNDLHLQALLITRGEKGMTLICAEDCTHFPAYAKEVYDVTGAGDTVIGVLGSAIAAGMDLIEATALANLAASLVVAKLGAATVSAAQLQAALINRSHTNTGIVNELQLSQAVKEARTQGKKIVFTNGCFDILHAGHVAYLALAKQYGDYLVVAINTDASVSALKGPERPFNTLANRMTVLAGLNSVDWVIPFADDTPERLLTLIQPDSLVKGADYTIDQIVGADIVRAYGGSVHIIDHDIHTSSTELIHRLGKKATGEQQGHG